MAIITFNVDDSIKNALVQKANQLGLSLEQFLNLVVRDILTRQKLEIPLEAELGQEDDDILYDDDVEWNEEVEVAYKQAMEELEREEAITIEFGKIKDFNEFYSMLQVK